MEIETNGDGNVVGDSDRLKKDMAKKNSEGR